MEDFIRRLDTPVGQLPEDNQAGGTQEISPFRIVGKCTVIIGLMLALILPYAKRGGSFGIVLSVVCVLIILGGIMIYGSRKKKRTLP